MDEWVERLSAAPIPIVLTACRERVRGLPETAGASALAALIAHEPLLCATLFREAGRAKEVQALAQVPALIGPAGFRERVLRAARLKVPLEGSSYQAFMQAVRRVYHGATLARHWAAADGYESPEEFFYAGLLAGVGELGVRLLRPAIGQAADEAVAGGEWDGGETPALGFPVRELSARLAVAWRLPRLARQLLSGVAQEGERKPRVVEEAAVLRAELALAPRSAEVEQRLAPLGGANALPGVFAVSRDTARELLDCIPLGPGPEHGFIDWYPGAYRWPQGIGLPDEERPEGRAREGRATSPTTATPASVAQRRRAEGRRSRGGARHEPVPHELGTRPAPSRPEATPPRGADARPRAAPGPSRPIGAQAAIEDALERAQSLPGIRRVVFAILSRDRETLRARYFRGVEEGSALRALGVGRRDPTLFARLLAKPQHYRNTRQNRERLAALFSPEMEALFEGVEFLASSVFAKERPIGVLYADPGPGRELSDETYARFKVLAQDLGNGLAGLGRSGPAPGAGRATKGSD